MDVVAITPKDAPRLPPALNELMAEVEQYYSKKILTHGPTPLGVDWSCKPTQEMRFVQLLKVCEFDAPVLINDIGCGYGALLAFLGKRFRSKSIDYLGVDVSPAMVAQAKKRWKNRANATFEVAITGYRTADYCLASGIFNVRLNQPLTAWEQMVKQTLNDMYARSRRGVAVNFLLPPAAGAQHTPELYYTPPETWSSYCERTLDADVQLVANYGMREYTLLVRKKSAPAR